MLHDGHQLHGVIACLFNAGKNQVGKFTVRANLALLLCHTHMGFVNEQGVFPFEALVCPLEGFPVVHHLGAEKPGFLVLHGAAGIQGNMLRAGHVGIHNGFYLAPIPQGIVTGQKNLPVSISNGGQGVTGLIPVVEISL